MEILLKIRWWYMKSLHRTSFSVIATLYSIISLSREKPEHFYCLKASSYMFEIEEDNEHIRTCIFPGQVFMIHISAFMLLETFASCFERTANVSDCCVRQQQNQFGFLKKLNYRTHWKNNLIISDDIAPRKNWL